ncbi:hypothetical protein An01g12860 [Aspergillus niger]|uniref:Uncharacterized protein n=2 Tax=Aspergillus niger TaxID=5061 RepID=A2QAV2_ASPNC|nr:hypothetical protein An01g12860 [Aspergillus niger]CAK37336.1 hypothetical protein An01g12860 [Aspergillus niger]
MTRKSEGKEVARIKGLFTPFYCKHKLFQSWSTNPQDSILEYPSIRTRTCISGCICFCICLSECMPVSDGYYAYKGTCIDEQT